MAYQVYAVWRALTWILPLLKLVIQKARADEEDHKHNQQRQDDSNPNVAHHMGEVLLFASVDPRAVRNVRRWRPCSGQDIAEDQVVGHVGHIVGRGTTQVDLHLLAIDGEVAQRRVQAQRQLLQLIDQYGIVARQIEAIQLEFLAAAAGGGIGQRGGRRCGGGYIQGRPIDARICGSDQCNWIRYILEAVVFQARQQIARQIERLE